MSRTTAGTSATREMSFSRPRAQRLQLNSATKTASRNQFLRLRLGLDDPEAPNFPTPLHIVVSSFASRTPFPRCVLDDRCANASAMIPSRHGKHATDLNVARQLMT